MQEKPMVDGNIGFALLGCGNIAQKYCSIILNHLKRASLVAVCDLDRQKAQSLGEKYDVSWFVSLDEMMDKMGDKIDVVTILTPSGYHCQNVLDLVTYGKHLCVEKPMSLTLEDADAMITACEKANLQLFVVNQNRFNVPIQELKKAISRDRFGKLTMGNVKLRWSRSQSYYDQAKWRGTWALDGGVFANQAYHFVDLLQWLMGDVKRLSAKGATRLASIETEDTGVAILQFANGALATIEATTATISSSQEVSITIVGQYGTVEVAGTAANDLRLWKFTHSTPEDEYLIGNGCKNPIDLPSFGHICYLESIVNTLIDGAPASVNGREGRKSLELISAIYEAIATGKEVEIGQSYEHSQLGKPLGTDSFSNGSPKDVPKDIREIVNMGVLA